MTRKDGMEVCHKIHRAVVLEAKKLTLKMCQRSATPSQWYQIHEKHLSTHFIAHFNIHRLLFHIV